MAACASARSCATPISPMMRISAAAFRRSRRRCCPAPRRSSATRRRSAAICCSGRGARISTDVASACNKREPGAGCDARGGENRLHAVLGWSEHCIATHPSDFCVPLVALDAVVEIAGPAGRREVPLADFHTAARRCAGARDGAGARRADRRHAPARPRRRRSPAHARYLKMRERTSYAFAVVSAAAALRMEGGVIAEARIALGGVAAKPWRAHAARGGAAPARADAAGIPPRGRGGAGGSGARPATTRSRSSSPAASWSARCRSPPPARRRACRRCRPPLSHRFPERSSMPDITLAALSPHVRHGSNIGQPLTRRDGVLKVTGARALRGRQPSAGHAVRRDSP